MIVAFDTETMAHRPGCKAPPMACLTWQTSEDNAPSIIHARDARQQFEGWLRDPGVLFTGHFIAYDMSVCAAAWPDLVSEIFEAYENDRVTCTMTREKLYDIACGTFRGFFDREGVWKRHNYDLDQVARRRAGIALKKDGWRRRYGEFIDVPLKEWPRRAAELAAEARVIVNAGSEDKDLIAIANGDPNEVLIYPLEDARATRAVHLAQDELEKQAGAPVFADQFRQTYASFWLTLMTTWGMRTYADGVEHLRAQTQAEVDRLTVSLMHEGLVRADGTRNIDAAKQRMLDVMGWIQHVEKDANGKKTFTYEKKRIDARKLRKTKGAGDVSLDRDACKESNDDVLVDYGDRTQNAAILSKDVPMLAAGTYYPIHPRIDIAASGRITMSAPNLANLRRLAGIRECIYPREGSIFIQADYPGLELHTLAQTCFTLFGYSALGDMLNKGVDPHLAFASRILRISYDEAKKNKKRKDVDDARQVGKVFNFGAPGGLGANPKKDGSDPTLIQFARKTYGIILTVEQVQEWKKEWLETLPEMRDFFKYVGDLTNNASGEATIVQLGSGRIRGGAPFCAACNTWFQGLGADATKAAGCKIAKACYAERRSPLYDSRTVNYIYDEFILETPERRCGDTWPEATAAARELARIMTVEANKWIPDCPFKDGEIEPLLMRLWSKEAEPLTGSDGGLVPWEPSLAAVIGLGKGVAARVEANPSLRMAA